MQNYNYNRFRFRGLKINLAEVLAEVGHGASWPPHFQHLGLVGLPLGLLGFCSVFFTGLGWRGLLSWIFPTVDSGILPKTFSFSMSWLATSIAVAFWRAFFKVKDCSLSNFRWIPTSRHPTTSLSLTILSSSLKLQPSLNCLKFTTNWNCLVWLLDRCIEFVPLHYLGWFRRIMRLQCLFAYIVHLFCWFVRL